VPSVSKWLNPESNRLIRELIRTVPPRQLVSFWSAMFFTFATTGFIADVMASGRGPLPLLVFGVIGAGLLGVAAVYGEINRRRLVLVTAASAYLLSVAILRRVFPLPQAPDPLRLTLDGVGMLASVCVAFLFFWDFISGTAARYLRAQAEIALARDIHRVLVPVVTAAYGEYEFFGFSEPSGDVGGDLVDVVGDESGWVGYVADVSGHGVGAGVVMAMFKSAVRMRLMTGGSLAHLLGDVNRVLIPLKQSNMFITAACVRSAGRDTLECAVAGHLPIVRIRGGVPEEVTTPQLSVGMFDAVDFQASIVECRCGDLLVLMTDGITEVFDHEQRELGFEHAKQLAAAHSTQPLAEIAKRLVAAARAHGAQLDDQTMLLIRRR
jgi:Stage II sporulation protein E (SpoIIE)